jgi:hypothetical protein
MLISISRFETSWMETYAYCKSNFYRQLYDLDGVRKV